MSSTAPVIEAGASRGQVGRGVGHFLRVGDAAERDVGQQLLAAAARQVVLGHAGHGEARADGERQDPLGGIAAGDRLGHADHSGLRRRIVPVGRAVAAIGRAAGDVDDPAAFAPLAPVQDGAPAKVGRGLQIDLQGPRPGGLPVGGVRIDRHGLEHPGVVDPARRSARPAAPAPCPTRRRRPRAGARSAPIAPAASARPCPATRAPLAARASTMDAPIPRVEPVTRTCGAGVTWPFSLAAAAPASHAQNIPLISNNLWSSPGRTGELRIRQTGV